MLGQLFGVESDAYRQSLHDLDPVAGCVLRWNGRERRARSTGESFDASAVDDSVSIEVGDEPDALAQDHLAELAFLEVRVDVQLANRHNAHQSGAGQDLLSHIDRTLCDDS